MKLKEMEHRSKTISRKLVGFPFPNICLGDVIQARANLRTGTSSGGSSLVVPELIKCLSVPHLFWFLELAEARVDCLALVNVPSWKIRLVIFLFKI